MGNSGSQKLNETARSPPHQRKMSLDLLRDWESEGKVFKLLLLGSGESGKSTLLKQMKIIHSDGYSHVERMKLQPSIHEHCVENAKLLVRAVDSLSLDFSIENMTHANKIVATESAFIETELLEAMNAVWRDPAAQEAYDNRRRFPIPDACKYFMDDLDRIGDGSYVPTDVDILQCRIRTTGVVEETFSVEGMQFRMVDVGGQRSERRKWIHCFDNVHAILYVCAISEFDYGIFEDPSRNSLEESFTLFSEICNNDIFPNTSIVVFLNKSDLLREKLKTVNPNDFVEGYTGGKDFEHYVQFVAKKFKALNQKHCEIYFHVTCATDTKQTEFLFETVKNILLKDNLKNHGMLL